jgi:hypothetical protein
MDLDCKQEENQLRHCWKSSEYSPLEHPTILKMLWKKRLTASFPRHHGRPEEAPRRATRKSKDE